MCPGVLGRKVTCLQLATISKGVVARLGTTANISPYTFSSNPTTIKHTDSNTSSSIHLFV